LESIGAGFFTGRMCFLAPKQLHQSTEVEITAGDGGGGARSGIETYYCHLMPLSRVTEMNCS